MFDHIYCDRVKRTSVSTHSTLSIEESSDYTFPMPGPEDTILAVAGLLAAFKGAIDGFLLIESMFEKDNGSRDLAHSYQIQKRILERWGEFQNIESPNPTDCRVFNAPVADQELVMMTLARIKALHEEAENYVNKHIDTGLTDGFMKRNRRTNSFGAIVKHLAVVQKSDNQKGRVSWAIKNKSKFGAVVKQLRRYNQDLEALLARPDAQIFNYTLPIHLLAGLDDADAIKKLRSVERSRVLVQHAATLKLMQEGLSNIPAAKKIRNDEITPQIQQIDEDQRFLGTRDFKNVWIEWMYLGDRDDSDAQMIRRQQQTLSAFLASISGTSFRAPPHLGYMEYDEFNNKKTPRWIGLVFEVPTGVSAKAPRSLQDVIRTCREPPLGRKFELAAALAQSLSMFHSANWLHKEFCCEKIVFFDNDGTAHGQYPNITNPFVTGFDVARQTEDVTEWVSARKRNPKSCGQSLRNYYDHPNVKQGACKAFDWYSFGVILLELTYWELIPDKVSREFPIEQQENLNINAILVDSLQHLPAITGSMFADVASLCLNCDFPKDDMELASVIVINIIQVLSELRA